MSIFNKVDDLVNDAKFQNVEKKFNSNNGLFIFDFIEESKITNFICDFEIICKSSYSAKFKVPDTIFLCAQTTLNKCFIPIEMI